MLKIVPAKQLVAAMEQVMNNPEMEIRMGEINMLSISDTQLVSGRYYVRLHYMTGLGMRMKKASDTTSMKAGLAAQFGKENVRYDAATQFYHLIIPKNAIADSGDAKGWTFAEVQERQLEVLRTFIPAEVLNFSD